MGKGASWIPIAPAPTSTSPTQMSCSEVKVSTKPKITRNMRFHSVITTIGRVSETLIGWRPRTQEVAGLTVSKTKLSGHKLINS